MHCLSETAYSNRRTSKSRCVHAIMSAVPCGGDYPTARERISGFQPATTAHSSGCFALRRGSIPENMRRTSRSCVLTDCLPLNSDPLSGKPAHLRMRHMGALSATQPHTRKDKTLRRSASPAAEPARPEGVHRSLSGHLLESCWLWH